jgi:hypothetical protein
MNNELHQYGTEKVSLEQLEEELKIHDSEIPIEEVDFSLISLSLT